MLDRPPKEKEALSWLYAAVWVLLTFMIVPLARTLQGFVRDNLGPETFTYTVLAAIALGLAGAGWLAYRHSRAFALRHLWLIAVAAIFVVRTLQLSGNPEEALHFVQYGILAVLLFRALSHRTRDCSIYLSSAVLVALIGLLDEVFQWAMPGRFWGYGDILNNATAGVLVMIGVALGLRPSFIRGWSGGMGRFLYFAAALVALTGLTFQNTPQRVAVYAEAIPFLSFLADGESMMVEYGYLYEDGENNVFRSRFSPKKLAEMDRQLGAAVAEILEPFTETESIRQFTPVYTPLKDPFLHEAGIHLFRRDYHLKLALADEPDDTTPALERFTISLRENQILERYFPTVMANSTRVWSAEQKASVEAKADLNWHHDSRVSQAVITRYTAQQIFWPFSIAFVLLVIAGFLVSRRERIHSKPTAP